MPVDRLLHFWLSDTYSEDGITQLSFAEHFNDNDMVRRKMRHALGA